MPTKYQPFVISSFHKTTILIMDEQTTELVASALEIVNPDDQKKEGVAREMALALQNL